MTDIREQLDALHEAVVEGKCEMGLNLDYCATHATRKKPGLGSCGPRKASLMRYAAEMQEAWPEVSKQLAAVERVREIHGPSPDGGSSGRQVCDECTAGGYSGFDITWPCPTIRALDVTP